ncbi:MAG: hypothetical protein K0U86_02915 [Planctomycetes bacterium]|nr:hypothetical protein [Planctomycetota bacterium]MCH9723841.1 hypothetical protein [Planctomycetota bacterium]MCH9776254.1 hypothetical protein [Planctomycetota bacterium]MCH9790410.1 hypothetical protein [Planctomycetota bacterium]
MLVLGTWSSGKLSWNQYHSDEACPLLSIIPACYLALTGYVLMLAGFVFQNRSLIFYWLFWWGLGMAGGLALLGSVMELISGDICPRAFEWIPMCYISLGFSVTVGILFAIITGSPAAPVATKSEPVNDN